MSRLCIAKLHSSRAIESLGNDLIALRAMRGAQGSQTYSSGGKRSSANDGLPKALVARGGAVQKSPKRFEARPASLPFTGFFCITQRFLTIEWTPPMTAKKSSESDQCLTDDASRLSASEPADPTIKLQQLSLQLAQGAACDVCGKPFEIIRRRGRPQRFCGDACRAAQLTAQKRGWSRGNWSRTREAKKFPQLQPETTNVEN